MNNDILNIPHIEDDEDFLNYKNTLEKEPEGDVKKRYCVGCYKPEDWQYIHEELMRDGSLEDNIPSDCCDCVDQKLHSETRAIYLLTDSEAIALKEHPRVKYVNVDIQFYRGTYLQNPKNVEYSYRWNHAAKHYRGDTWWLDGQLSNKTNIGEDTGRTGYQLYRMSQKEDPWINESKGITYGYATNWGNIANYSTNSHLTNQINENNGTGRDVDLVVGDNQCWFGHAEFQDFRTFQSTPVPQGYWPYGPYDWDGGNVLNSNFSASASNGSCQLLDLVLEAPYYLDPTYFEADPNNRLETRWDGTTVPVEQVAKSWWGNVNSRSSTTILGGATISIPASYTRANCNGTFQNRNVPQIPGGASHGTSCASQAYGKWHGWAYNANKWYVDVYSAYGLGAENYFDMLKLFHLYKPNRTSDDSKNPTVSSNSWGFRVPLSALLTGYYYFRSGTLGGGGQQYDIDDGTGTVDWGASPRFLTHFTGPNTLFQCEMVDNSQTQAGEELIDSGVIFVHAAGNENQKMVQSDHPDYNNYIYPTANQTLAQSIAQYAGNNYTLTVNRKGFPGQIGKVNNNDGSVTYRTICIGALDCNYDNQGRERKVYYSNMGNAVDAYAPGEMTIAATAQDGAVNGYSFLYERHPGTAYSYDGVNLSEISYDNSFTGSSSACPLAAGLIATVLEQNRGWNYSSVLLYISNNVGTQTPIQFYSGSESTQYNDQNFTDFHSIEGGSPTILWNAPLGGFVPDAQNYYSDEGELTDHFITEKWFIDQYIGDRLVTTGDNALGQLGNGSFTTDSGSFYKHYDINNQAKDSWKDIKCGGYHTLAVTREGVLYSWGADSDGQLGDGNAGGNITVPNSTSLGTQFTRIKIISAGLQHSAMISTQKLLYTWGANGAGQLGNGTNNSTGTPTPVNTDLDWVQVSGKGFHTMAIKDNGTLWATGNNTYGQLGLGDTSDRNTFTQVGTDEDWLTVSAGRNHTLALKKDGTLWAWGGNYLTNGNVSGREGILGIGNNVQQYYDTPQQVGSNNHWKSISAGGYHSAAIKDDGSLYLWGRNDDGQLGLDNQGSVSIPTLVSTTYVVGNYELNIGQWKDVSCGETHTAAVKFNGSAWSWGDNSNRQLGQPSTINTNRIEFPHLMEPNAGDSFRHKASVKMISAGFRHTAFVTSGSAPEYYVNYG